MGNSVYVIENKLLTSDRDRFVNCIIDFFVIPIVIFLFTLVVVLTGNVFQLDVYRIWIQIMIDLGMLGTYIFFAMLYYLVVESLFGISVGKLVTRSVVVNENGLKPSFASICIRTFCRLIPFDALSFLGNSGKIWHDSISNTYVVDKKILDKEMKSFYDFNSIGAE